jgi:hypothetical protein
MYVNGKMMWIVHTISLSIVLFKIVKKQLQINKHVWSEAAV